MPDGKLGEDSRGSGKGRLGTVEEAAARRTEAIRSVMVLWKLQDEADIHVVQQGSILLAVRKGCEVGMTEQEKLEQAINGLEQFIADLKTFCGNKTDWQRVYDALAILKAQEPRLMSLEEVLASTGKPVYVICEEHPDGYALVSGEIGCRVALAYPGTPEGKNNMLWPIKAGYGSFWECWTAPPIKLTKE